jgi:hypothetical protein
LAPIKYSSINANRAFANYTLTDTVFPTGVVTARPGSKILTTSLDNLTNTIDMKEWVAPESNKTEALNLSIGTVAVTTSDSPSGSPGIST